VRVVLLLLVLLAISCADPDQRNEITISASAVGAEGAILQRQLARFEALHPQARVRIQQTPDDATQRHQLYVQWLNARLGHPDVLQLDVVWTPELAAAGWILPLGHRFSDMADFVPATTEANQWKQEIYAIPWFVDVGMLYRRTDIVVNEPETLDDIVSASRKRPQSIPSGFVWQGARYEGLVTVFVEILAAHDGKIFDAGGRPTLSSAEAIEALQWMRDAVESGVSPPAIVTWHEEETRFAFQNGGALFMRNWPYAVQLLEDESESAVASRFAISPMPPAKAGGRSVATLGGAQLAVNRWSKHPELASELIAFLTAPEQMLERAVATGQYPSRLSLYGTPELDRALGTDSSTVRDIVASAVARPSSPVYSEISEALQIELHRALTGETPVVEALARADGQITEILERSGLAGTSR
jgi:multiple sugar transport system substrate-binding protein